MKIVKVLISILLIAIFLTSGCATGRPPVPSEFAIPSMAEGEVSNPKLAMAICYEPEGISISPNAPYYSLPLDLGEVTNFAEVGLKIRAE